MSRKYLHRQRQLERIEVRAVIPPSLAEAFEAVENLDARHPSARGTTFGAIRTAEARANHHKQN
jgi:hypothetical protein